MNLLSVISFFGVFAVALSATVSFPPLSDAEIEYINNLEGNSWKAGRNFHPQEHARLKNLLGVDMEANTLYNKLHLPYPELVYPEINLPEHFDGRVRWPNCSTIREIRDQSNCGSCWAFGSVEAQSDRYCSLGGVSVNLSPEDTLSCCVDCGMGCQGGYPTKAYEYWVNQGVVTGGAFGTKGTCEPYMIPPCHTPTINCTRLHPTPKCIRRCQPGYSKTFEQDKRYGAQYYGVSGVENIMRELVTKGSVTTAFTVYSDFFSYKSGVYKHRSPVVQGGHAVKIIGYGTEEGQDYWLVANSWGTEWGLNGFFKIAKGIDECDIESNIVAGTPRV